MASLVLSAGDRRRLERAHAALLSALEYEHVDDWRSDVNRAVKELLGADLATFHLALPGLEPLHSEEVDLEKLRTYPAHLRSWQARFGLERRMREMGVWTRESLWREKLPILHGSEYWHDFVVPTRAYDSLAATVPLQSTGGSTSIYFHHESRKGPRFGARGEALLRLLYPAFLAGVTSRIHLEAARHRLAALFDTIAQPLQLVDLAGHVLHRNPALLELLGNEPASHELESGMNELVRDLDRQVRRGGELVHRIVSRPPARTISTSGGTYRLRAALAPDTLAGRTTASVTVDAQDAGLPSDDEMRGRFRLTGREAQVARLLVERRTNREIAGFLGISPHTARRHTERVLDKLDVRSRREVRARLMGSDAPADR